MSTFHHELFHNLQRSLTMHGGGDGSVDGDSEAWQFFSEGTAFLASTVALPDVHFGASGSDRRHLATANVQIAHHGWDSDTMVGGYGVLYWRFLYEQCGGMAVVRNALKTLYSGEIVDITVSTNLVPSLPKIMDRALADTPSCPFATFQQSLVEFSRALYALRLDGGRCVAPDTPRGCGFYDPRHLYDTPAAKTIVYAGRADPLHWADITTSFSLRSFGMRFLEVAMDPAADGESVTLDLRGSVEGDTAFIVQVWRLIDQAPVAGPEVLTQVRRNGRPVYRIPRIDTNLWNRLGVVVTRVDANEQTHFRAGYTIRVRPSEAEEDLAWQ
jgi:hypothetical protein